MENTTNYSIRSLAAEIGKSPKDFTKSDIIRYICDNEIRHINFQYPAGDGRLKTLNFVINDLEYLEEILSCGERVDGSSLFPFIEANNSDLYVVPRFRTAYMDPFSELPTINFLCAFFNKDGNPLESSPEYTLHKACEAFRKSTGREFQAMGELEYYVIAPDENMYQAVDQKGYHESAPYAKFGEFRQLCMNFIARTGGRITIAKWIIRNLAYREGLDVTFAPKITVGKAGSGLHVHFRVMKDGLNQMLKDGVLSDDAKRAIAGLMMLAPSLTAFGNTNPTSYFRLVPHQEAPTNVCWGDRNRSVLVRVPLGWTSKKDLCSQANPGEPSAHYDTTQKQTVEMRSPDGSANVYLLIAGLAVACRYGFECENALDVAAKTYVNVNIHKDENRSILETLSVLPDSCAASADCLAEQRAIYEAEGVFSPAMLDGIIAGLKAFNDRTLRSDINNDQKKILALVETYFHCG